MRHIAAQRIACALALSALARMAQACPLETIAGATVQHVVDGRTFVLTDGREIRLAGIEAPDAAKSALAALTQGRTVTLKATSGEPDRHGRTVAYAYLADVGTSSIQESLLAQGQVRVAARTGSRACALSLWAAEREARAARLGLWATAAALATDDPAAVAAERGRFALLEGEVLSVREAGATLYVNFGRRWSEDVTVTVPKRSERTFAAAGLELRKLTGRHVRVRGTIEERGGPWIEALAPEQIEVVQDTELAREAQTDRRH